MSELQAAATATAEASRCGDLSAGVPATFLPGEKISPCGRPNPLAVPEPERTAEAGRDFVLHYPVETTGFLLPYRAFRAILEGETDSLIRKLVAKLFPKVNGLRGLDAVYEMVGLVDGLEGEHWGVSVLDTPDGEGLTFSCATCHTGTLFGQPVFGLFNRQSRANELFDVAWPISELVTPGVFDLVTGATDGERAMWKRTRENMRYIRSIAPRAAGLDTALTHTMLSLMQRESDAWATKTESSWKHPRYSELANHPTEVKPATWWLTKYKTRYFSDGSLDAGNPVLAALIINEIGRGSDLYELDAWLERNRAKLDELTTAVFSATPPSFFDFFAPEEFDLEAAKRGQVVFEQRCARCHGTYEKGWQQGEQKSLRAQLATTNVIYFEQTANRKVGTDDNRAKAVDYLQELNALALFEKNGLRLTTYEGYVPPPLVGIFARWPYFHNGSAQSLCAVLTRSDARPETYVSGEILDPETEFDRDCNGYLEDAPAGFGDVFDTRLPGLAKSGHDEGIFLSQGRELLSPAEKRDVIRFLQTL